MNSDWLKNKGQSILEVILALAIFALFAAAMVSLILGSFEALGRGGDYLAAAALADEAEEAARSIRDGAWNESSVNQSAATSTSGEWQFVGEGTDEQIGKFHRVLSFSPVCRDGAAKIVTCPAGVIDLHSRAAKVVIDWTTPVGTAAAVERQTMFTNWDSRDWLQTDWSGGSGQEIWSDPTRYTSDDGNLDITSTGEVKLRATTVSAGSANSGFDTDTGNWSFATWDVGGGEVTPTGSWQATGGNPDGYASITIPRDASGDTVGAYWQQAVVVPEDGLPLLCSTDWRVAAWSVQGNLVDDFRFFMFLDSAAAAPVISQAVWSSSLVTGTTNWAGTGPVDCSSSAVTAGTYYFKIAVWLDARARRTGPITAGFDNASVAWQKTSYALSGELVSSAFDMSDPSPIQIIEWNEQVPACSPACTIRFQIRAAADQPALAAAPWSTDFTAAAGTLINTSYNGNRWLQYRVLLEGDDQATPVVSEIRLNYK